MRFEVSGAIGRDENGGQIFPVILMDVPKGFRNQSHYRMTSSDAMDLATSLITASIRAESDTLVVRTLLNRGATRNECQKFLDEMRALDD